MPCCLIALIAASLCHIVRILHCQSVIIVRLSRLSMPTSRHQLPKYPLLLTLSVSNFSRVITKHTNNNAAFGDSVRSRSAIRHGEWRRDEIGYYTHPPPMPTGRGRSPIPKFSPYFYKKVIPSPFCLIVSRTVTHLIRDYVYAKKIPRKNSGDNFPSMFYWVGLLRISRFVG